MAGTPAPDQGMDHRAWMAAAEEEHRRLLALLSGLAATEWRAPTDCPAWDVRALVAHLVGAAEAAASLRETLRQQRLGRRLLPDADAVDAMNALQVRERAERAPADLLRALADVGPRALRARSRLPAPLRALPVPLGPPLGVRPLGYLTDRVYTRDAWMHRIDIARATGRAPVVTAEHDGALVADAVAEWAATHGQPFRLRLTGPAGGSWSAGVEGELIALDAIELCRRLAGRGAGSGLLRVSIPF